MLAPVAKLEDLSFVSGKNLWRPVRTGNYAEDTARGRRYADELLTYIRLKNCPMAFSQVARAMTQAGRYEAVEIGFCSRIGIHLVVAPACARSEPLIG